MFKFSKTIVALAITVSLLMVGCGTAAKKPAKAGGEHGKVDITDQVKAAGFPIVDFDYVKGKAGVRKLKEVVIVDARPARKYDGMTIPGAINIPDTKFKKFYPQLEKLGITKDVEIITFCGGFKCIKSLKDAKMLRDKGYKNIKVYLAGMPDWKKQKTYGEIGLKSTKKMMDKAVLVDARPARKFKGGTIAGSVSIPDTKFKNKKHQAKFMKLLPTNKKALIIPYCGGYHCNKSHIVAKILVEMGYTNVRVMAAGLPGWKKAGFSAKKGAAKKKAAKAMSAAAIPMGAEEGTVNKKWFRENVIDASKRPAGITVVDVRTPGEFSAGHVDGAKNISIDLLYKDDDSGCKVVGEMVKNIPGTKIFMCASGGRAGEMYFGLLEDCGFPKENIRFLDAHVNYDGGQCKID